MRCLAAILVATVCTLWAVAGTAQEISPRLFWPTPKDTQVLVSGYSYATGDVLFDASIPIEDADSRVNTGLLAYTRTISLWGRTSNFLVEQPYSWGKTQGLLLGEPAKRDFSGTGDLGITLNVNLRGAPSMTKEEFLAFRANPRPLIGASLKVIAPTGQYNNDRLVNTGSNRWAARAKIGAVFTLKPKLLLELSAGAWLFGDNDEFVTGKKEQDPIYSIETNLIKRIRPGLWASLDLTYYNGGRQTVNDNALRDKQSNLKVGGTLVVPFWRRHAIKIGYANGVVTRYGNAFDQIIVSYQFVLK
jgi:hypothetical protein